MARRLETRLEGSKPFKDRIGRPLISVEIERLYEFHHRVGYTPDRIHAIVQFILLGYDDWSSIWNKLKTLHNGTLEYQTLLYGDVMGKTKYLELNKKKTKGFDHSSDAQREKGKKSAKLSKGNKEWSVRGLGYWIKKGYTKDESLEKVKAIQITNCLDRYIKKYGIDEGTQKFNDRKNTWKKTMNSSIIGKKRSLGLWRYVERYGEAEGEKKYIEMRIKRNSKCSIGRASAESLDALSPIIRILDQNGINYYIGIEGNKEWFIFNKKEKKMFFYDLTIPSLGIIVEYHGEGFHPNPNWEEKMLTEWRQVRTGKGAKEVMDYTKMKNLTAIENRWTVFEIFSSEVSNTVPRIKDVILKSIRS